MKPQNVVLVGAGAISDAWLPAIQSEGLTLSAVVDLDRDRAVQQLEAHQMSAPIEQDLSETIAKYRPDLVVDITPPEARVQVSGLALRAGVPVLCEKPLAANITDARELASIAKEAGVLFAVSQSRRWENGPATLRSVVQQGELGAVTSIHCDFFIAAHFGDFAKEATDDPEQTYATKTCMDLNASMHPLLGDLAIHHFDMARFITGHDAFSVYAVEYNPIGSWFKGGGSAVVIVEFPGNIIFSYRASWMSEGFPTSWNGAWRVTTERGTVRMIDTDEVEAEIVAEDRGFRRPLRRHPVSTVSLEPAGIQGALHDMVTAIAEGRNPDSPASENIQSIAIVFAAIESAKRGSKVEMKEFLS